MPMRRLMAPKINSFYVQIGRLLFLPSSTSALVAVILAGLTFGFLHFPLFIVLIFHVLFFLFFLYFVDLVLFLFIFPLFFSYYLLFIWFDFFRSLRCQIALLNSWPGMLYCIVECLWTSHPPFASFTYLSHWLVSPVPVSIIFPCFYFLDFFLVFVIISSIWAYHVACARFTFQIFARAGRTRAICRMRGSHACDLSHARVARVRFVPRAGRTRAICHMRG